MPREVSVVRPRVCVCDKDGEKERESVCVCFIELVRKRKSA